MWAFQQSRSHRPTPNQSDRILHGTATLDRTKALDFFLENPQVLTGPLLEEKYLPLEGEMIENEYHPLESSPPGDFKYPTFKQ